MYIHTQNNLNYIFIVEFSDFNKNKNKKKRNNHKVH